MTAMYCISTDDLRVAALAACHHIWNLNYDGSFDWDCPDRERWIAEEMQALLPALDVLGIEIEQEAP